MAGNQSPKRQGADGANMGWTAVGYLLGGIAVWALVGWLVDRWLHLGGVATGVGAVLGAVGGIYLVFRKLGGGGS
jgi:F0F1-type ATP synthase assembly protein I